MLLRRRLAWLRRRNRLTLRLRRHLALLLWRRSLPLLLLLLNRWTLRRSHLPLWLRDRTLLHRRDHLPLLRLLNARALLLHRRRLPLLLLLNRRPLFLLRSPRPRLLLHSLIVYRQRSRSPHVAIRRKWLANRHARGPPMVDTRKLSPIGAGSTLILHLRRHRR